jgi:hypothetical protein
MSMPVSVLQAPVPSEQQRWKDEEHLRLLSIFHLVVGGLAACVLPFLVIHFLFFMTFFANAAAFPGAKEGAFPREMIPIFIAFYCFAGLVTSVYAGGNLLSGWFLRRKTHRVFSFVVAGLDCLSIPWGTVLGVLTILVLTRPSVQRMYEIDPHTPC